MSAFFVDVARDEDDDDDDDDDDLEAPLRVEPPNESVDWIREGLTLRVFADVSGSILLWWLVA